MDICKIENCSKKTHAKNLCPMHYDRLRTYGNPLKTKCRPKGTGQIFHGYKIIYVNGKPIREHRYIMEQFLGRELKPFPQEIVHHINKNLLDNRTENLELKSQSQHVIDHLRKSIIKGNNKFCTKCNKFVPINNFHKIKITISGLRPHCKTCTKKTKLKTTCCTKMTPDLSK